MMKLNSQKKQSLLFSGNVSTTYLSATVSNLGTVVIGSLIATGGNIGSVTIANATITTLTAASFIVGTFKSLLHHT